MKIFIDHIGVHDRGLAYTIAAALEKDGEYSVELYDRDSYGNPLKEPVSDGAQIYNLRIFYEKKLEQLPVGFSGEDKADEV